MSEPNLAVSRRLERLERVLAGREKRLAATIARPARRPHEFRGPLAGLQRYGYAAALALVTAAILPTLTALAWRRRRLITGVALNSIGVWKMRRQFNAVRRDRGDR